MKENRSNIIIRECRESDIIEMLSMLASEGIYHSEDLYLLVYESYRDLILVAEKDEKIIAFVMGALSSEDSGRILVLFVRKEYRGLGIGRKLMEAVIKRFVTKYGVREISLEVHEKNLPAIKLYESLGFKKAKKLVGYYDGEDGWLMVKEVLP
ncbi:MAG TPA: N-acetyltransferase [Euryarchaeota archaeon]|nr:N-acetyltransferase [Euryarchaeota archaeon]